MSHADRIIQIVVLLILMSDGIGPLLQISAVIVPEWRFSREVRTVNVDEFQLKQVSKRKELRGNFTRAIHHIIDSLKIHHPKNIRE
ncbi:hypothetical protein D3C87_2009530 [compost metagenome]